MKRTVIIAIGLGFILLTSKCSTKHDEGHGHDEHFMHSIKNHTAEVQYSKNNELIDSANLIKIHSDLDGVEDFFTEKRLYSMASFPCTSCHKPKLGNMKPLKDSIMKKAHWNIKLHHADNASMNCTTCHSDKDINKLTSLTGKMISMDESFKLCGQCHSTQFKDWQGGAHGKQLNGWKPPRVAKTCVSCHNPHKPAFGTRFPARLNTHQWEDDE